MKSITWTIDGWKFLLGIVLMGVGHTWFGILIWIVSIRKEVEW